MRKNGSYYEKEGWLAPTTITELGEMSFPRSMSEAEQRAEVARRVQAWLATKTEVFEGKILVEGGD